MPVVQSRYPEAGWIIPAIACVIKTMGTIYIDYIIELPEDNGYRITMICINQFSKMVVLLLLSESNTWTVASHFLVEVMSPHRHLATITSDKDPRF